MADATILSEQTLEFTVINDNAAINVDVSFVLVARNKYEVLWGSDKFTLVATEFDDTIYIGNLSCLGSGDDTGEPFIIAYFLDGSGCVVGTKDLTSTSRTVAVYQVDESGETSDTDIIVYDRLGSPVEYSGVGRIRVETSDGGTTEYINCDIEAANVSLDFSKTDTMTITPANGALFDEVNIPKPVNLLPEYIAEGIDIAGVSGSFAGGSGTPDELKPIRFYDPYGNVIYGYTKKEIQELEELPEGPALSGLVFDQWTHTLDDLKSELYFADVGPMYKYGSSPATVLIVETIRASTAITVCITTTSGSLTIYWGDGASSTISHSSTQPRTASHTYAEAGEYNISLVTTGSVFNIGGSNNSYIYNVLYNSTSVQYSDDSYLKGTIDFYLKSILVGSYNQYGYASTNIHGACFNTRLTFISSYSLNNIIGGGRPKQFAQCPGLRTIATKGYIVGGKYALLFDTSLRRLRVRASADALTLDGCDGLEEVEYDTIGAIAIPKMNAQWAMLMNSETPPTIQAANPIWGTKPIYVPDTAVDAYKTAAGWSTVANYILPASQYHKN